MVANAVVYSVATLQVKENSEAYHECMKFVNAEINPDSDQPIDVVSKGKRSDNIVKQHCTHLDTFGTSFAVDRQNCSCFGASFAIPQEQHDVIHQIIRIYTKNVFSTHLSQPKS